VGTPYVCTVVLNWNRREDTLDCLASLERMDYTNHEVIVVDNASGDGSAEAIAAAHPAVDVIQTGSNLGYAEGNNVGLREAMERGAEYVLVLNNDTVAESQMLTHLVAALEADEGIGAAGPTIYFHEAPDTIWSAGGRFDWRRGKPVLRGLRERDTGQFALVSEVDYLPGSAILMRRDTLAQVGGFESRYFMYYEDNDWCFRAGRRGFSVVHVPEARLWHKISLTRQFSAPYISYYHARNRLLFLRTAGAGLGTWTRVLVFDLFRSLASWTLLRRHRGKRAQRDALWSGMWDYWRGRFGPYERWHQKGWAQG
jgi:GT2 family glycosyltransferase